MTGSDAATSPEAAGYIRGGGGVEISAGRAVRVLGYLAVICLLGLAVGLTVSAVDQNSRTDLLRGAVPVEATVSGCEGISSGIGMGIEYWSCRASYEFAGKRYDEVIGGSRTHLTTGQALTVAVSPRDPTVATTLDEARKKSPGGTAFIGPAVLFVLAGAGLVWLVASRPRAGGQAGAAT
jgi:Protein of unknown function (DUF3592)